MTEGIHGISRTEIDCGAAIRPDTADLELIDKFLTNRLDRKELDMVETRIVAEPEFRREVELTEALRDGIRELARKGEIIPLLAPQTSFWSRPPVAVAASFIVGLLAVNSFLLSERLDQAHQQLAAATDRQALPELAAPTNTETLLFEHTRSGEGAPDVIWRRSSTPTLLNLHFDIGLEPAPGYTITIERIASGADATVLTVSNVGVDVDGLAVIAVNSELLDLGTYRVSLKPHAGADWEQTVHAYILAVTD